MQSLAFTMRDFATVRDFEAARAKLRDSLRAALDFDTGETTMMHTPGPWTVDPKTLAVYAPDRHGHASAVRVAECGRTLLPTAEIAANAALVAAAPDLLAALQALVGEADLGEIDNEDNARLLLDWARAAIARATGDQ